MIILTPNKIHVLPYEDKSDPDFKFSISWKFPTGTSKEMETLKQNIEARDGSAVTVDKILVDCIQDQTGFFLEDGVTPLDMKNLSHRQAIYDFTKTLPEYRLMVLTAYTGPRAKNLLAGATPVSTGNGVQVDAQAAS